MPGQGQKGGGLGYSYFTYIVKIFRTHFVACQAAVIKGKDASMQKFVTIYLDNAAYGKPKVTGCYSDRHGLIEEHLKDFLDAGWRVVSFSGIGGAASPACQGWFGVLLEKETES